MKWFERQLNFDIYLLGALLALAFFGLLMVYSTSFALSMQLHGNPYYYLKKEVIFLLVGLAAMVTAMHFNHERMGMFGSLFIIAAFAGLVAVFFFPPIHKAHRWLGIAGYKFQPSELAKLATILYFARSLAKRQEKLGKLITGLGLYLAIILVFAGLVLLEPDFGGALSIAMLGMIMLYAAETRLSFLTTLTAVALPPVIYFMVSQTYRWNRLISFLEPWQHRDGYGFQLVQSFLAFGNGGLFGTGLGMGHQKLFYLPDAHTDFIFSVIAEECGWVVVLAVITTYLVVITRGITAAIFAPDRYSCYLATGLTAMIGLPAMINMAVVTGLLPTKGLVLPFLSYGGSSLLINMFAAGILLNVSAKRYRQ